jgi:hypothetical protein
VFEILRRIEQRAIAERGDGGKKSELNGEIAEAAATLRWRDNPVAHRRLFIARRSSARALRRPLAS